MMYWKKFKIKLGSYLFESFFPMCTGAGSVALNFRTVQPVRAKHRFHDNQNDFIQIPRAWRVHKCNGVSRM